MSTRVLELFGHSTSGPKLNWTQIAQEQQCPFLSRKCLKVRKSQPEISIGTCTVAYGGAGAPVMTCPYRLIERRQIFIDCLHLLTLHEPGNELHAVPEIAVPGGSVDYFLLSALDGHVKDFVGIELQTLDSTGTVWPERERFLKSVGVAARPEDVDSTKAFGMNWKMTSKTILVQLHHKVQTFESLSKHLVLAVQDRLLDYMNRAFSFGHLSNPARVGDFMQFHSYSLSAAKSAYRLKLETRLSTDAAGVATALGLQVSPNMEYEVLIRALEGKMSSRTLLTI